mmetsp:Transcript_14765/g.32639  ORF Transcript_14765/g.32639 Transcript_14765/m.32639 type:complete len:363 (+) Transcript_14765:1602-2690(+)
MYSDGRYKVPPSGGMWPLFCHEIGLSYEQEDKVRTWQKKCLAKKKLWVDRYTVDLGWKVVNSLHKSIHGTAHAVKRRETSVSSILTGEQRLRLVSYLHRGKLRVLKFCEHCLTSNVKRSCPPIDVSSDKPDALNLHAINTRLRAINDHLPNAPSIVPESRLKKLSRRPSYESLGGSHKDLGGSHKDLSSVQSSQSSQLSLVSTGASSCPSEGGDVSMCTDGNGESVQVPNEAIPVTTPEEAQLLAAPHVSATIGSILPGTFDAPTAQASYCEEMAMRGSAMRRSSVQATEEGRLALQLHSRSEVGNGSGYKSIVLLERENSPMNVVPEENNEFGINIEPNENFLFDMTDMTDEDWNFSAFEF